MRQASSDTHRAATQSSVEQGKNHRHQAAPTDQARMSTRTKPQMDGKTRDLAMFTLAIDSRLRGRDVVHIKVEDVRRRFRFPGEVTSGQTADTCSWLQAKRDQRCRERPIWDRAL